MATSGVSVEPSASRVRRVQIIIHDTLTAMRGLLALPVAERADALRDMLAPLEGMYTTMGIPVRADEPGGMDVVAMHHGGSGFRVDQHDERYARAIDRLAEEGVAQQVEQALAEAWRYQVDVTPDIGRAKQVHVVIVLGNPDDEHLVVRNAGYFGFGGIPGYIQLLICPTGDNVHKLRYAAVHELNHNIRYANVAWDPMTVTVGEQVVAEGLAEAYVRELHGPAAMGPWATSLSEADVDGAYDKITRDIDVAGMQHLTPYVHGDATARLMGAQPVGLPDHAGYAVGLRIVDAHLSATGRSVAESTALPVSQILRNAGIATSG